MANILIEDSAYISTSSACIVDLLPPTFAGIATMVVQSRGQMRATWLAASDVTAPIRYEVYIKASTATGLFNVANIIAITDKLQYDAFTMPDGSFLVNGTTYYMGVRAIDGVNNRDSNTVSLNVISTGVSVAADVYKAEGTFVIGTNNQLQGTMWILKNSVLGTGATLGTASYQVYDKTGTAVPGMGQSGIAADSNGQFKITPVTSTLSLELNHYVVKIDITMDSAVRTGYVPMQEPAPEYEISGVFSINQNNELVGTYWAESNQEQITNLSRLGTSTYQVYDLDGNAVVGFTESGITPDSLGLYKTTPIASSLDLNATNYYVKISTTIDGLVRTHFLSIIAVNKEYEAKAVFSINALNQLQATLWVTEGDMIKKGSGLGTASYTVYDSAGIPVVGLTQSGITADANGRFITTPVSASLLTDLTHFTVRVAITADGVLRESYIGFTLLGT